MAVELEKETWMAEELGTVITAVGGGAGAYSVLACGGDCVLDGGGWGGGDGARGEIADLWELGGGDGGEQTYAQRGEGVSDANHRGFGGRAELREALLWGSG